MFIVEKPFKFAQRIHRATQLRDECENRLKFDAVVDEIILSEIPKPPQRLRDNIRKLLFHPFSIRWIEIFEWEYCMLYQKALAALELIMFLEGDPHSFPSIQLPTMERRRRLESLKTNNGKTFETSRGDFQRMWLNCCPEAIKIMEFINNGCNDVNRMSLFHIQTTAARSLMGFVDDNRKEFAAISDFLKQQWIEDVVLEVKRRLADVGKGWLDLNVNNWSVYRMSKLLRLIKLIQCRMETAVRCMSRSSLGAFVNHLCQPCEPLLSVAVDFVWGNDLATSWFPSPQPVFTIELNFDDVNEPAYTTGIEEFEAEIIEIVQSRILMTHDIPQFEAYLVTQLKFDKGRRLSSVGLLDDEVQKQIHHISRCYQQCSIPLHAYAEEFRKFVDIKSLNIPKYVRRLKESDKTSKEVKEEILQQLKSIDEIELTVPPTIVIGPFQIDVSAMKKDLVVKRRGLHDSILAMFSSGVGEKIKAINGELKAMIAKLKKKCETVEQLLEVREWIAGIPFEMNQIESRLTTILEDFDIIDSMCVAVSDDIFQLKFTTRQLPQVVLGKIDATQSKHQFEFELFRKLQSTHETQFLERIEALAVDVDVYSFQHDFDELSKVSADVDKLWSDLNEMMTRGEMLNNRQKIFNQPEIDMERLTVLAERLRPHHTLWTMASNFLRSKEDWTTSPLSSVDIDVIGAEVKRCENVLQDSRLHFASNAEMMVLIGKVAKFAEDVNKTFDVMRDLKNPDIQPEHWLLLSQRTAIECSPEITFDSLLVRGIVEIADVVKQVSVEATRERNVRELEEVETERKRQQEEEIREQKKARRAARKYV